MWLLIVTLLRYVVSLFLLCGEDKDRESANGAENFIQIENTFIAYCMRGGDLTIQLFLSSQ